MKFGATLALLAGAALAKSGFDTRPIVGILDQHSDSSHGNCYIAASYVKWAESAGLRVIPLHYKWSTSKLEKVLKQINGVLLPGGAGDFADKTYWGAVKTIWDTAIKINDNGDVFPLWGTCLGFEQLICLPSNDIHLKDETFSADAVSWPLVFKDAIKTSKLYKGMPSEVFDILSTQNVTYNHHVHGISEKLFNETPALTGFYDLLSVNADEKGVVFVSTIEAKKYPFFGTQWHPEKAAFEWETKQVNHGKESLTANQWTANFFADYVRMNTQSFTNTTYEETLLIYNTRPRYNGPNGSFVQSYYWTYN